MIVTEEMRQKQIEREKEMYDLGGKRYQDRIKATTERDGFSYSAPGNLLVRAGIEKLAKRIELWCINHNPQVQRNSYLNAMVDQGLPLSINTAPPSPRIHPVISETESDVLAVIALRAIVDEFQTTKAIPYTALAMKIGRAVEDEHRLRALQGKDRKVYDQAVKRAKNRGRRELRRQLLVRTANSVKVELGWDQGFLLRIGVLLIELVQKATGILKMVLGHIGAKKDQLVVCPSKRIVTWLRKFDADGLISSPLLMPMLIPPRSWSTPYDGGYHQQGKGTEVRPMVKTRDKYYLKDLEALAPAAVYSAVNAVQAVAWEVNAEAFAVVQREWKARGDGLILPDRREIPLPKKPPDFATNEAARKKWRKAAHEVHRQRAKKWSRELLTETIIKDANRDTGHPIWFPCQLDYRGRVYTMPTGLTPQGNDLAKGLLRFHEGKPLDTPEAVRWWKIHGANCAGRDKESFDARVKWVDENWADIVACGSDPASLDLWKYQDEPWQFLAWCMEAARRENDKAMLSHLPIRLDGSCSGLQHFAAMVRNEVDAAMVNLTPSTPSDEPHDAYEEVAKHVCQRLEDMWNDATPSNQKDEKSTTIGTLARMWIAWFDENHSMVRKLAKPLVMTWPYGSTPFSRRQTVRDVVTEWGRSTGKGRPFGIAFKDAISFITQEIGRVTKEQISSATTVMAWLRGCVEKSAKHGKHGTPIRWTTPAGFPVKQDIRDRESEQVETSDGEKTYKLSLSWETKTICKKKMMGSISPNFVHSMDAAALMLAVNRAAELGITSLAVVHDSFGTHAVDTERFAKVIRETMARMYTEHDVLGDFQRSMAAMGVLTDSPPRHGTFNPARIIDATYAFA